MTVTESVYGVDYGTLFGGIQDQLTSALTAVGPTAAGLIGAVIAIGFGIKIVKRFAK